jgi:pyridoxal phosphate enzyme (YggS family)
MTLPPPPDAAPSRGQFLANLASLRARIAAACATAGRNPDTVTLLPVTKTHGAHAALLAHEAGFTAVGENRVQEAAQKRPLAPPSLRWELIGHLQGNKIKQALATFDRIQTVDSPELVQRLAQHCDATGKTLPLLLQANPAADPAKHGPGDLDTLRHLAALTATHPGLRIEGLMTIPRLDATAAATQRTFDTLRTWRDALAQDLGMPLPELSMGMSNDLELAIAAGATLIRVGTALYGTRS